VKALRANLLAELDANDQAVAQLLPQVQISLDLVEKAVGGAATGMSELVAENKRLVELAEKSSDEAETRAQALLATVQSQRDTLQQQANELTGSWDGLESELKTQLTQLQSEFLAVGSAATTSLKGLSEQLATQSTQAQGGAHTALFTETISELQKLAVDLGQRVLELKTLGDSPRNLAEQDLHQLGVRLRDTAEGPLELVKQIHAKAASHRLFEPQFDFR